MSASAASAPEIPSLSACSSARRAGNASPSAHRSGVIQAVAFAASRSSPGPSGIETKLRHAWQMATSSTSISSRAASSAASIDEIAVIATGNQAVCHPCETGLGRIGHLPMHRCYDAMMPKHRTTVTIDERVMRAVRVKAARTGRRDSDVIEEALRRDLGFDLLERIWERADLDEQEAMKLAVEAQHEARES